MATRGKKISEQTLATSLDGNEIIPFAKNGADGAVKASKIKEYVQPDLTAKQDKLVNSADVTIGIDNKLSVTDLAKKKVFIDKWNTACIVGGRKYGSYNATTGFFELNGLTDITYEEALKVDRESTAYLSRISAGGFDSRTLYPIRCALTDWTIVALPAEFNGSHIEVINFATPLSLKSTFVAMFHNCQKLHTIQGVIRCDITQENFANKAFSWCSALENLQLSSLKVSISFPDSPLLSLDSISYMVTNAANTSPITITLHPAAYARLTDELIAQATEKQITFATPT